jgi:serine/threonine protein kinase
MADNTKSNIIGTGSYGCVYKPSLKCSNKKYPPEFYKGKVSKLIKIDKADAELDETTTVDNIDRLHKFTLPPPATCIFATSTPENFEIASKCEVFKKHNEKLPNELALILMNDGGQALHEWLRTINNKEEEMRIFWANAISLFLGVQLFGKYDFMHHDIKLANIVYNNHRFNFIDFGISRKMYSPSTLLNVSVWAYYPPEYIFIYKTENGETPNYYNVELTMKHNNALFSDMINHITDTTDIKLDEFINRFELTLGLIIQGRISYNMLANLSLRSFDLYQLGFALMRMLCDTKAYVPRQIFDRFHALFWSCMDPLITHRSTVPSAIKWYKDILRSEYFKGVNASPDSLIKTAIHVPTPAAAKTAIYVPPPVAVKKVKPVVNKTQKQCPAGKEMNPTTGRCNKTCKAGLVRNAKFQCRQPK